MFKSSYYKIGGFFHIRKEKYENTQQNNLGDNTGDDGNDGGNSEEKQPNS